MRSDIPTMSPEAAFIAVGLFTTILGLATYFAWFRYQQIPIWLGKLFPKGPINHRKWASSKSGKWFIRLFSLSTFLIMVTVMSVGLLRYVVSSTACYEDPAEETKISFSSPLFKKTLPDVLSSPPITYSLDTSYFSCDYDAGIVNYRVVYDVDDVNQEKVVGEFEQYLLSQGFEKEQLGEEEAKYTRAVYTRVVKSNDDKENVTIISLAFDEEDGSKLMKITVSMW